MKPTVTKEVQQSCIVRQCLPPSPSDIHSTGTLPMCHYPNVRYTGVKGWGWGCKPGVWLCAVAGVVGLECGFEAWVWVWRVGFRLGCGCGVDGGVQVWVSPPSSVWAATWLTVMDVGTAHLARVPPGPSHWPSEIRLHRIPDFTIRPDTGFLYYPALISVRIPPLVRPYPEVASINTLLIWQTYFVYPDKLLHFETIQQKRHYFFLCCICLSLSLYS